MEILLARAQGRICANLAYDALTCSFCLLGPMCASFLEDCSLMGEMMAKGPAVRSMEWLDD